MSNIRGDVIPSNRQYCGIPHIPFDVNRQVRCATPDITDNDSHFTFGFGEHNFSRSKWIENKLHHLNAGSPNTLP